jgi:hypothetical protein
MPVPSQLSGNDVNVLNDCMNFVAKFGSYRYLEIGSYLGASLQWHLSKSNCVQVVSIDKRSRDKIKDERQIDYAYTVTTQDMISTLKSNGLLVDKLITIDGTVDDIPKDTMFDLVFVDAEHTNQAVYYDAVKCLESMKKDAVIMFHDDWIIYKGIESFEQHLLETQQTFCKFKMNGSDITVIVMGSFIEPFQSQLGNNSVPWKQLVDSSEKRLARKI